jgi:hypothetical protein
MISVCKIGTEKGEIAVADPTKMVKAYFGRNQIFVCCENFEGFLHQHSNLHLATSWVARTFQNIKDEIFQYEKHRVLTIDDHIKQHTYIHISAQDLQTPHE